MKNNAHSSPMLEAATMFCLLVASGCARPIGPASPVKSANGKHSQTQEFNERSGACLVVNTVALELCKLAHEGASIVTGSEVVTRKYPLHQFADDQETMASAFPNHAALITRFVEQSKSESKHGCASEAPAVDFVSPEAIRVLQHDPAHWWTDFRRSKPESCGIARFSTVAFDDDHDYALLYAEINYGELAADGSYWLLHKEEGKWAVVKRQNLWIL